MRQQFRTLMGFELPVHPTNTLDAGCVRLDLVFEGVADSLYRQPSRAEALWRFAQAWLARCNCELTRALAGYVAYCREDYPRATIHFLSAVAANPHNLDNWVDLAFSLIHQGDRLGLDLLFDHHPYMSAFVSRRAPVCTLAMLRDIGSSLARQGTTYRETWRHHVPAAFVGQDRGPGGCPPGKGRDVAEL